MAEVHDFPAHRKVRPRQRPPATRNREILAQLRGRQEALDTPEARLVSELRGLEETLLANHRHYVRLWEAADRLGIIPPVRTAAQVVAGADGFPPPGTPPLPPSLSFPAGARAEAQQHPSPGDIAADSGGPTTPEPGRGKGRGR